MDNVVHSLNQHLGLLFRNEKEISNMVYTNSVRMSVCRRIIREKLGIDDVAFDALVDQELAKREDELKRAQKAALDKAEQHAVEKAAEKIKGAGVPDETTDAPVAEIETREFGGDFGEEQTPDGHEPDDVLEEEEADLHTPDDDSGGRGPEESEGAVEEVGPDPGGVQPMADGREEGQPADSV